MIVPASEISGVGYLPLFLAAVIVLLLLTAGMLCTVYRRAWPLLLTPLLAVTWGTVGLLVIRTLSAIGIKP